MAVRYLNFDGEKVSREWYVLLRDIRVIDKVNFHVNEGHRTIKRQWQLYRYYLADTKNHPIAAFPSPTAPHIRTGRSDHAIDFDNAEGVRIAAAKRGVTLTRTVLWPNGTVREEWHLEANRKQLRAYYKRRHKNVFSLGWRVLKAGKHGDDVAALQHLLMRAGVLRKGLKVGKIFGPRTKAAVKRFQRSHHLRVDGQVGPATLLALRKSLVRKAKRK